MKFKTKAPADAVNIDEGAAGMALGGSIPVSDNTKRTQTSQGILHLLSVGESNAISAAELARVLGWNARSVTLEINRLRLAGVAICASGAGYFLPADAADIARYARSFDRRLKQMHATRAALDNALTAATGQSTLWDGGNDE